MVTKSHNRTAKVERLPVTKDNLVALISRFQTHGIAWFPEDPPLKISQETFQAATKFVALLPAGISLPKAAPNEESALVLIWETASDKTLVIIDGWKLHLGVAINSPTPVKAENIPFHGAEIPDLVLDSLPKCEPLPV